MILRILFLTLVWGLFLPGGNANAQRALAPVVIAEETVTTCKSPGNGAGPLWCSGSPLIFREGEKVFASVMETGEGIELLCNTRWRLFERGSEGWRMVQAALGYRLREPSPLLGFAGKSLFLSINPSLEPPGVHYGRCLPTLVKLDLADPSLPPATETPMWEGNPKFTDHSYRGVAADGANGEILWMNIDADTSIQHLSYRNSQGQWSYRGGIEFPARGCYPQVALKNKAAHVMAIGDIVEPIQEWQEFKYSQSGQKWDYVFRRLFYTWSPDISQEGLREPLEIESLESTSGHITNLDLWIGPEGEAHILYVKQTVQSEVMRDRFFPHMPIPVSLEYTVVREGKIVRRESLVVGGEGGGNTTPSYGRFHATTDGRLWAVYSATVKDPETGGVYFRQFAMQVHPEVKRQEACEIPLKDPFSCFFTATERGGGVPSDTLDLFGICRNGEILQYAQIGLLGK